MDAYLEKEINMKLDCVTPKTFLCKYTLKFGAFVVGILFAVIMCVTIIATSLQVVAMGNRKDVALEYPWRNAYGYSCNAVAYALAMLGVHLWFLYGVKKGKTSVILSWIVISSMWLIQSTILLLILIFLYSRYTKAIILYPCLIFGLLATGVLVYCVLVVCGHWLEIKYKYEEREAKQNIELK